MDPLFNPFEFEQIGLPGNFKRNLDKSLIGLESRYGGGGGGGGENPDDRSVREHREAMKKAWEDYEDLADTWADERDDELDSWGRIYDVTRGRWNNFKEKTNHPTRKNPQGHGDFLDKRKEDLDEYAICVRFEGYKDDYGQVSIKSMQPKFKYDKDDIPSKYEDYDLKNWPKGSDKGEFKGYAFIGVPDEGTKIDMNDVYKKVKDKFGRSRYGGLKGAITKWFTDDYQWGNGQWLVDKSNSHYNKLMKEIRTDNRKTDITEEYNKKWNNVSEDIDKDNKKLNKQNTAKNKAYDLIISTSNSTTGGDFVSQRDNARTQIANILDNGDLNQTDIDALLGQAYLSYKDFYREEKLEEWDINLAAPIPGLEGATFDAHYYRGLKPGVKTQWDEALAIDDIDITERYGYDELIPDHTYLAGLNTFALQDWSNVGRHAGLRAYAPTEAEQAEAYEEVVTDADKQAVRDKQLGIDYQTAQTDRLFKIDEIASEYTKALGGDPYWKKLGKERFLDPTDKDQFAILYKLSEEPAHVEIMQKYGVNMDYSPTGAVGITQMEDAINQAIGEKGTIDVQKFGALTQNVLSDTIAEMKKAKKKEEFLSVVGGFSGFGEITNINTDLTNSILGDSGVGGYLSMISGGRAEESLERSLRNITGVNNNVTYNWQKWFDDTLVEKYGQDYKVFLPYEEKEDILTAFANPNLTVKPWDAEKKEFSQEFLDLAGYKNTKELEDFLNANIDEELKGSMDINMDGVLDHKDTGSYAILELIKDENAGSIIEDSDDRYYGRWGMNDQTAEKFNAILNPIRTKIKELDDELNRNYEVTYRGEATEDINNDGVIDDQDRPSKTFQIEAAFGRNFIDTYLKPRFDTSRSMDEFVEYLDVRQEHQNPFQTQDMLNAVQMVAEGHAQSFLDAIRVEDKRRFSTDFYMDPTIGGENVARQDDYIEQRDRIADDWDDAKNRPHALVDNNLPSLGTWAQNIYHFGIDVNNKNEFARLHFEIVGQGKGYDPAEDHINPTKVKDFIYETVLPLLDDEALEQGTVFGLFITPEEFADDMLKGLDPNNKDTWEEILERYGLEEFGGSIDELRQYIIEGFRTGSAQQIRENIKYLNDKRKEPTQQTLGVTYIQREEDHITSAPKADTVLYKRFQESGYQGTEEEFYRDFFPDLNQSEQILLTKGGKDDPLKTWGLDMSDPFASLGTVQSFFEDEEKVVVDDKTQDVAVKPKSYFSYDLTEDDDWEYRPRKKEDEVLDEFTTLFKGF